MTEIATLEPNVETPPAAAGSGCLGELAWLLIGAVLPLGSFTFYRRAVQRPVMSALTFFVLFTLAISTLATIGVGTSMFSVVGDIRRAYAGGEVPEVVIRGGVAEVEGPQPFILVDESTPSSDPTLVAIDTTGQLREIDTRLYNQGILLTRTEVHLLNRQGDYQVIPLRELHTAFERDPIVLDAGTVSQAWSVLSAVIVVFMFAVFVLWHVVLRLMFLAMAALVIWGFVSILRPNTGFGAVIIPALYAIVPAIYIAHLFSRSELGIAGLQTLFLLFFWAIGLSVTLVKPQPLPDDQPLRPWTGLLGAPMVILYAVDAVWRIPPPYGNAVLWIVTIVTWAALAGLRLFLRFNKPGPAADPAGGDGRMPE